MTPLEQQFADIQSAWPGASLSRLPSGAHLVTIPDVKLPDGWNRASTTILFLAPPGYPASKPDCFWVQPTGMRLKGEATPQGTNDSNPIPEVSGRSTTWFSWHVKEWNPNGDTLKTYVNVIMQRFGSLE